MALFATSAWADETYYLQDPAQTNGTPVLTGDFYTAAPLSFNVGKEYSSVTYKKGLTFAGNINGASSNMKNADRFVRYDCKTDNTDITVLVYSNSASKKYYDWTIQENATIGSACTMSSVTERDATNGEIISKTYTITNNTRTSFYVSVGASSNVSVVQVIAVEKGTAFPAPCEAGYQVNFNKGRYAGKSNTIGYLDKTSEIDGLEIYPYADYYGSSSGNIQLSTNNTHYIKFAVAAPLMLNFTTANSKKYTVSKTKGDTKGQITPTAGTAENIKLTSAGTYYINPQESGLQVTGMSFSAAPKITYDANGGSNSMDPSYFTVAACTFTAPTGKKFIGWNTQADGKGTAYAPDDEVTENVTLYAQWGQTYAVTYDATTGSGTMTDANSPYLAGDEVTLLENTFEAPNASSAWSGWDVYKTGEPTTKVEVSEGKFTMPAYNVTVAAQWATAYDVKFFQGYGEPDVQIGETQSIGEGAFAIAPADPERAGYEFAGWSYDATKAHIVNVAEYAISAETNFTAIWDEIYTITKAAVTNGSITVSAESAIAGTSITLTATPAFRYVFGAWDVYKTGDESTKVTVTNNKFTMPEYAVTVSATFTADARKQILYLKSSTSTSNDKMYSALNSVEDYNVIVEVPASQTVTNYDLVVLHESLSGNLAKSDGNAMIRGLKTADVPVLNTKSYFYNSDRWDWGTPNAGTSVTGATLNDEYTNITSHPIFEGVTISEGFVTLFSEAKAKAMQPIGSFVSGKEGYTLAKTPNDNSGNGCAIHELTPAQRGVASGKYLMISIGNENGCFGVLTENGQKLLQNAAAYLLSNEAWVPSTTPTALDNTEVGAKAVKTLKNGVLIIEKNGKKYNIIGSEIR